MNDSKRFLWVVLPVVGLVTWACFAYAQIGRDLDAFQNFNGMHCE